MRLSQLVSILDRRALWFAALSEFEDKFEGAHTRRDMQRYRQLRKRTERAEGAPAFLVPVDIRQRLKHIRDRVYASCWYAGDEESAALWQRSPRDTDFVAVQTTFGDLRATIRLNLFAGYVRYDIDYRRHQMPEESILYPFFCKRRIFAHENEVRALLYAPEIADPPPGQYVSVSPNRLIRRVMLAPFTKPWVRDAIEALLRHYQVRCPVVRSEVDAAPTW